jgi:uncharacterized protein (UPF0335 family)
MEQPGSATLASSRAAITERNMRGNTSAQGWLSVIVGLAETLRPESSSTSQARGLTCRLLSLHTCVPLEEGVRMTNTAGIPGDRICSFIERVERIDEEIKALNEGKKEVFSEAKGEGFDVKVLREILRLRKQDKEDRDEQHSLLDLYLRAMESAGSSQAEAA